MDDGITFELDTREFDSAIQQYVQVTSRDTQFAVNSKAKDVALRAMEYTGFAEKSSITGLKDQTWWWAYLRKRAKGKNISRANLEAFGDKIIEARVRSIKFIRIAWAPAARILAESVGMSGLRIQRGRSPLGGAIAGEYSETNDMTAILWNSAGATNSRSSGQALLAQAPALQQALDVVAKDMEVYLQKKMEERGEQYSVK